MPAFLGENLTKEERRGRVSCMWLPGEGVRTFLSPELKLWQRGWGKEAQDRRVSGQRAPEPCCPQVCRRCWSQRAAPDHHGARVVEQERLNEMSRDVGGGQP